MGDVETVISRRAVLASPLALALKGKGRMERGMFNPPPGAKVDFHHIFQRSDMTSQRYAAPYAIPRSPVLLTIEPWTGIGDAVRYVRDELSNPEVGEVWLRYAHEFNGDWYPWTDPEQVKADFRAISAVKGTNVKLVWCPNVIYPGSSDVDRYWPGDGVVDIIGMDGYNQMNDDPSVGARTVFYPTLDELRRLGLTQPVMICETASPRGRGQLEYVRTLINFATHERLVAVAWFNLDKEQPWALGQKALKAFLG